MSPSSFVSFNHDLSEWDIGEVVTMEEMFYGATSFDQAMCWDISVVNNTKNIYTIN